MASYSVQECCAFRHFCIILDRDLEVSSHRCHQLLQEASSGRILTGNSMERQLALLTT
uniref:Uncharacterized protein n=1 Tax=Sciurus vulgaris TaxID=55149 RepID=A0A8D2DJP3_SCIVU